MKKSKFCYFACISALFLVFVITSPTLSNADVNGNISVPLPRLVIPAPPAMLVVPGTYVYYPPDVSEDIFFYRGYWYRPYRGRWFIANGYNGPWRTIAIGRIPRPVIGIPPGFRHDPLVYERVPHREMRRNWRGWERERHWDRDRYERRERHREDSGRGDHNRGRHEHERGHQLR